MPNSNNSDTTRETVMYSLTFTKKQLADYERWAKLLNAEDLAGLIQQGLVLANFIGTSMDQGCEVLMVQTGRSKVMITEDGKKIAILGASKDIKFVTKELKEIIGIQEKIKESNQGLLVDDIGSYAMKNN